ncbi:MAG: hypothetical protein ACRC6F_04570, partial [Aeromonas sp.]
IMHTNPWLLVDNQKCTVLKHYPVHTSSRIKNKAGNPTRVAHKRDIVATWRVFGKQLTARLLRLNNHCAR